jgi:SAM-dependent methyltransferase
MKLTADGSEALESLSLEGMPEGLATLRPKDVLPLCDAALAKFRVHFEGIDAHRHEGLRREIEHVLQPTIFSANFHTVLGHAARIPNLAASSGLDLGCSFGLKTVLLKHFGAGRIFGCDVAPDLIRGANIWLEQSPIRDMRFFINPVDTLPFEDGQFDWITCMGLYANLNPAATVGLFKSCARVLRPGGRLFFHDSANPHHEASAVRIREHHRRHEMGDGTPDKPNGPIFLARRTLIASQFPEMNETQASELARLTGYMTEEEIVVATRRFLADGTLPASPFVPDDLSRIPLWPSGSSSMRTTDPFVIRAELAEAGFKTRFRRPVLGADIEEHELEAYFKSAPGVFLSAQKTA